MNWRVAHLALPVLALGISIEVSRTATAANAPPKPPQLSVHSGNSVLLVTPYEGHSGDTVYLSGSGLAPNKKLWVVMDCPSWHDRTATVYGNQKTDYDGPTTNARGEFAGFPFQVLTLQHLRSSPCQIYVPDGDNLFGPDIPGTFSILPPDTAARRCQRVMCVGAKVAPRRVRAGNSEMITINGWPGAQASVTVIYPGSKPYTRRGVVLNWQGQRAITIPTLTRVSQPESASVEVSVRLGGRSGRWHGGFVVVH